MIEKIQEWQSKYATIQENMSHLELMITELSAELDKKKQILNETEIRLYQTQTKLEEYVNKSKEETNYIANNQQILPSGNEKNSETASHSITNNLYDKCHSYIDEREEGLIDRNNIRNEDVNSLCVDNKLLKIGNNNSDESNSSYQVGSSKNMKSSALDELQNIPTFIEPTDAALTQNIVIPSSPSSPSPSLKLLAQKRLVSELGSPFENKAVSSAKDIDECGSLVASSDDASRNSSAGVELEETDDSSLDYSEVCSSPISFLTTTVDNTNKVKPSVVSKDNNFQQLVQEQLGDAEKMSFYVEDSCIVLEVPPDTAHIASPMERKKSYSGAKSANQITQTDSYDLEELLEDLRRKPHKVRVARQYSFRDVAVDTADLDPNHRFVSIPANDMETMVDMDSVITGSSSHQHKGAAQAGSGFGDHAKYNKNSGEDYYHKNKNDATADDSTFPGTQIRCLSGYWKSVSCEVAHSSGDRATMSSPDVLDALKGQVPMLSALFSAQIGPTSNLLCVQQSSSWTDFEEEYVHLSLVRPDSLLNCISSVAYCVGHANFLQGESKTSQIIAVVTFVDVIFTEFSVMNIGARKGEKSLTSLRLNVSNDRLSVVIVASMNKGCDVRLTLNMERLYGSSLPDPLTFAKCKQVCRWSSALLHSARILENIRVSVTRSQLKATPIPVCVGDGPDVSESMSTSSVIGASTSGTSLFSFGLSTQSTKSDEKFTVFVVEVAYGGNKWEVSHRYNDFAALRECVLTESRGHVPPLVLPSFPGKTLRAASEAVLISRMKSLEDYLTALLRGGACALPNIVDALSAFLEVTCFCLSFSFIRKDCLVACFVGS